MKQQSKTILEWFEEARAAGHEWADAAIEYCHQFRTTDKEAKSLSVALYDGFAWNKTAQGVCFWAYVLDPLPKNP